MYTVYHPYGPLISEVNPNLMGSTGRLACWRLRLSEFAFDDFLRAGVKHQANDVLSCLQTTGEEDTPREGNMLLHVVDAKTDSMGVPVINTNSIVIIPLNTHKKNPIDEPPMLEELVTERRSTSVAWQQPSVSATPDPRSASNNAVPLLKNLWSMSPSKS